MKRIISAPIIFLTIVLFSGCVTYGPRAESNSTDRAASEAAVVAAIGGFRGIVKDENEFAFQKEARDRLINEHSSLTVWQTSF